MDIEYHPELWKHLHWKDPQSSFYFKRIKSPGKLVKDKQSILDLKGRYVNRFQSCIYSGRLLTKDKVIDGLLSDSLLSMLCGLPFDIYETSLNDLFKLLKLSDQSTSFIEIYSKFKEYRDSIWSQNYYYVIKEYKQKRSKVDFLYFDFDTLHVGPLDYYQDNLKKFLYEIFEQLEGESSPYIMGMYKDIQTRLDYLNRFLRYYQPMLRDFICISIVVSLHTYLVSMNIIPIPLTDVLLQLDDMNYIRYYDDTTLPDEVIQQKLGISEPQLNVCIRSYLNIFQSVKNCVFKQDTQYSRSFRLNALNVSNYIWNVWSKKHSIEEAILQGDSETIDQMNLGTSEDKWTQKNPFILFQKFNEYLGNQVSTKLTVESDTTMGYESQDGTDDDTLQPMKMMKQDLETMEFQVNNQPVLFD